MAYPPHAIGSDQLAHDTAKVNDVELHYAHAGNGPLILFLHGFPQCWYQYHQQPAEFARDHLAVAWSFALHHPQLLSTLAILDTPRPALFDDARRNDPEIPRERRGRQSKGPGGCSHAVAHVRFTRCISRAGRSGA